MAIATTDGVLAATMEQAMAQCREQLTPAVRGCVRDKMMANHDPNPQKYIPGCRAPLAGQMKDCVAKLIGAAGFKDQPAEAAKEPAKNTTLAAASRPRVAPPRTIADITAILDQEKPDPARLKKLQTAADAQEPAKADPVALAHFYFGRAVVRSEVGRSTEAVADAARAVELAGGKVDVTVLNNFRSTLALQLLLAGEPKQALLVYLKLAETTEQSDNKGFLFIAYRQITNIYLTLGDLERAEAYVKQSEALWTKASAIRGFADHGGNWQASVEDAKGRLFEARGRLEDALRSYELSEQLRRSNIEKSAHAMIAIPRTTLEAAIDLELLSIARVNSRLGRIAEAETDARRALLSRLHATGKYQATTARYIASLGMLLVAQGRYDEAKKLITATIDIYREIGVPEESQSFVTTMNSLAGVQALQSQWTDAIASYMAIDRATQNWEAARRAPFRGNFGRVETLYRSGRVEEGLAIGRRLLDFRIGRYGDQNTDTALARGLYAVGLSLAKRDDEARVAFAASVPLLTATTFETDNDDAVNAASRTRYTQIVVESYIALLERLGAAAGPDVASDTFRLADSIRGHSVQKALTAAGARMTTSDPKLAAALRQEQDLRQQVGTQLGQLSSLLALPVAARDDAGVAAMRKDIDKIRAEHVRVRADIDRQFPEYADLIDPKPPTSEQIKAMLRPDEALLSFYFGRDASFVWAIAHDGKVEFAALREDAATIENKIKKLREALEPQVTMVADIPEFDLALAHDLYKTLLEPVKPAWGDAKRLVVVTNGALGLLPLGLLTTAPHELSNDGPIFSAYRAVPWLSRTHAVTMVPSASAFRALRRLPAGSPKREKLIAFGDPWFNEKQAADAVSGTVVLADAEVPTRGIPLRA